jgi:hypothetical protein
MDGSDRFYQVVAGFVSDALARALICHLPSKERSYVLGLALKNLPPEPGRDQDPSLHQAWTTAREELRNSRSHHRGPPPPRNADDHGTDQVAHKAEGDCPQHRASSSTIVHNHAVIRMPICGRVVAAGVA